MICRKHGNICKYPDLNGHCDPSCYDLHNIVAKDNPPMIADNINESWHTEEITKEGYYLVYIKPANPRDIYGKAKIERWKKIG